MFFKNNKKFDTSRENLLTMESEEAVYEDPELLFTKKVDSYRQPPVIFPKRKDTAAYKVNSTKVTLHPESANLSNQKQWTSSRSVYPMGDGRYISRQKGDNIGTSMPDVRGTNSAATAGSRKPPKNKKHSSQDHHSKVDSCCHCCCFFLLYMLTIAIGLAFYLLHMHIYYPHIKQYSDLNETMTKTREDCAISRSLATKICKEFYYNKTNNQTFANRKCRKLLNPDKNVNDADSFDDFHTTHRLPTNIH